MGPQKMGPGPNKNKWGLAPFSTIFFTADKAEKINNREGI